MAGACGAAYHRPTTTSTQWKINLTEKIWFWDPIQENTTDQPTDLLNEKNQYHTKNTALRSNLGKCQRPTTSKLNCKVQSCGCSDLYKLSHKTLKLVNKWYDPRFPRENPRIIQRIWFSEYFSHIWSVAIWNYKEILFPLC